MAIEYQPLTSLDASRVKLREIAALEPEIEDQTLYEGILDVMASRGGEKWKQLDELWLNTDHGIKLIIGCSEPPVESNELVFITTVDERQNRNLY